MGDNEKITVGQLGGIEDQDRSIRAAALAT